MNFQLISMCFIIGLVRATEAASEDLVSIKKIPGTSLYTGVFYTISMKKFPSGLITWTDDEVKNKDASYLQIDLNPKNLPHYKPDNKWENETQWYFESSEEEGYYNLKNKGISNGILTLRKETDDGYKYVIVAKKPELICKLSTIRGSLRKDTFIKPVKIDGSGRMYQLKFHSYPEGTVTWTETKYGDHSHYIQITGKEPQNYLKGGRWYDDTQFQFLPTSHTKEILERMMINQFEPSC